ncbi:PVC-type heme-binding CxxCH protein [Limnoglobus roseus]|uniref:Putative beta-propeller-type glycoside hydrolase n=1 Tax=Limnoglobus roseus TaxID=2598579 RepID=A0A5C1A8E9_9BACT|nr:PVC-type heme-binding CxxCH protein [Limnoglobus roseus]QEL14286.1 putative beta-propeller-type glycoside hydrolase [Limnoglobus roseus]
MARTVLALIALSLAAPVFADPPLKVPAGFTITKVAGPPLVKFPVIGDFDDKGRLYVIDMAGPINREDVAASKPLHRIVRLEDTDGDGTFDKAVTFADKLPFPEGCMYLAGSVYTACPPQILKLTDTDGDGIADKREVWFDGKTLTGCANDLHGPYRGPDGYIYWTKGAFAKQELTLGNGEKFTTRASHVFRAKPDGSGLEVVMTGGMDNPVGLAFTASGDLIVSNTFLQHPADGKRDGLIHAIPGGVWGKDHDPIYEHPWTSPKLMPVMTHLGPAAPTGICRYEMRDFGDEYLDNIFCAQFNLRKVSSHQLVPTGSTYRTIDRDFVTSDDPDFHPTDVIPDADGSLLIIDTGGWYKLCCPSSQLVKAEALGGIYRVKMKGEHDQNPLRTEQKLDRKSELTLALKAFRSGIPALRERAIAELARRKPADVVDALDLMANSYTPIWSEEGMLAYAFLRVGTPEAVTAIRTGLEGHTFSGDGYAAACRSLGLVRDPKAVDVLIKRTNDAPRAVAEALGRIGSKKAVPHLLYMLGRVDERLKEREQRGENDQHLDHTIVYALIEIGDYDTTAEGLKSKTARVLRGVLAALQAIDAKRLKSADVLPHLSSADADLRETAWWIAAKHTDWGSELVGHFREKLAAKLSDAEREDLTSRLAKFAKNEAMQKLLADTAANPISLRAMARANLKATPESWPTALAAGMKANPADTIATVRALSMKRPPTELADALRLIGADAKLPSGLRLTALAALPDQALTPDDFDFARSLLGVESAAADVILRSNLSAPQLAKLATMLNTAGPVERAKLLPAFTKSTDETVGLALVAALNQPKVRAAIRSEQVRPILDKYPAAVKAEAAKLYAVLDAEILKQREKLEALVKELPPGDVQRGHKVFNSPKAACATCHTIGYVGGKTGPDLTRIGSIRTERDLLESIVFPSLSFVRSYEPVSVNTLDGKQFSGILKKDAPDEVILVTAADKEERIARDNIESLKPGTVSIMPAGLDQQLSKQDLADLVAFLRASK